MPLLPIILMTVVTFIELLLCSSSVLRTGCVVAPLIPGKDAAVITIVAKETVVAIPEPWGSSQEGQVEQGAQNHRGRKYQGEF